MSHPLCPFRSGQRRLQASEVALSGSQAEVASLRQEADTQAALLVEQGERLHGLEMERRRLHNQLQELKGNIRVFCRVRPVLPGEPTPSPGFLLFPSGPGGSSDPPTRLSVSRSDERRGTLSGTPAPTTRHDFSFDRVFPPGSGQDQVFEEIAMLVQSALDGYPVCIFAYGQTGSGKTFTMEGGPGGDPQAEGLIPRALRHLFSVAQELGGQGWTYSFVASYVEIYNETVRDLLATGTRKGQSSECEIRRAGPGSEELTVTNARYVPVSCEKEVSPKGHWDWRSGEECSGWPRMQVEGGGDRREWRGGGRVGLVGGSTHQFWPVGCKVNLSALGNKGVE